jgi:hypothetical protein
MLFIAQQPQDAAVAAVNLSFAEFSAKPLSISPYHLSIERKSLQNKLLIAGSLCDTDQRYFDIDA